MSEGLSVCSNCVGAVLKNNCLCVRVCVCKYVCVQCVCVHTPVLEQLGHLVLYGSGDTMKRSHLVQSFYQVLVLSVQSTYTHSSHRKVLQDPPTTHTNTHTKLSTTGPEG